MDERLFSESEFVSWCPSGLLLPRNLRPGSDGSEEDYMKTTPESLIVASRKEIATSFLRLAANGDVRRAFESYTGASFRHHNPHFRGDAESLAVAMQDNASQNPDR